MVKGSKSKSNQGRKEERRDIVVLGKTQAREIGMGNYEYTHSINTPQISERKERSSMDDAWTTLFGNVSDSPGREGIPKKKQCAIDMPRRLFFFDCLAEVLTRAIPY
eukprot:scaffold4854_cov130-Amphora_coffeaeformis.AAC.1